METELERQLLERLKALEDRMVELEDNQRQLQQAYGTSRMLLRRFFLRPPMWTFEQHSPRQLDLHSRQPETASVIFKLTITLTEAPEHSKNSTPQAPPPHAFV